MEATGKKRGNEGKSERNEELEVGGGLEWGPVCDLSDSDRHSKLTMFASQRSDPRTLLGLKVIPSQTHTSWLTGGWTMD